MIYWKSLKIHFFRFAAVVALTLGVSTQVYVYAQVSGAVLSGSITDASGAPIPDVTISIKNTATAVTRDVVTDSVGFYSAPNLLPGTYNVTISVKGFATVVESSLSLAVGEARSLDRTMQVGLVTEQINVTATEATVQLSSSAISAEVNATTMRELPLNGRDWTQLAALQAGIVPARTQPTSGSQGTSPRGNRGFGNELSDAGHRPSENNYRINGITVVDYANEGPGNVLGAALGVDAIQEFSVVTSNYTAEYGRASGAVINAITKSGTNTFHGDAFWFMRDKVLDARNFFDTRLPPFHRNQFGVSGGGPIKKDKTFIFVAYEGIRQRRSFSFHDFVPSAAAREGSLCSIPNDTCTPTTIAINPLVKPFLGFYPLPNAGLVGNGDTGIFNASGLARFTENYVTARGDQKISNKDSLAVSWFWDRAPFVSPDPLGDVLNELFTFRQTGGLEETHVFSPTLVNTARVAFSRSVGLNNVPVSAINPLAADHSFAAVPGGFAPILAVPGLTLMQGSLGAPSHTDHVYNSFQFYDDAFLTRGSHSLKLGFAWERMQYNVFSVSRANGFFRFPSLAGFLQNKPSSVALSDPAFTREVGNRQTLFGAYLQDDWHWRPNLTLNFGVRYEPTTLPTEAHDRFQVVQNFYGGGPVPVKTLWAHNQTLLNFAPRVGFSWDPFHDGKTAIRGGFGIFDVLPLIWLYGLNNASSLPFQFTESASNLPPGSFPKGAFALLGFNQKIANVAFYEQNPHRAYAMNWNFNIQREIIPTLTATIGYVGSHSVHQSFSTDSSDMVLPTLTSAGYLWPLPVGSGTRLNTSVGNLRAVIADNSGSYEGLQVQVKERMSHGFLAQGSYTWGKCFDYGSSAGVGDQFNNSLASPLFFARRVRRGLCDYNVAHNFVLNYVWDLPSPKFGGAVAQQVLGGWELGGVFTASTGTPFTLLIAGDPAGQGGDPWPFPDRLTGPGCTGNPVNAGNPNNFVKLNCFSPPIAPASFAPLCQPAAPSVAAVIPNTCMNLFGNAGRNQLIGPGLVNFDFSLFKNFPVARISETFRVQFRAEFFNVFNHPNFQSPLDNNYIFNEDGTPVGGAGAINSTTTDSRQIQFALKVIW
ncbi:MAG TPA: TonB-dependent receptor [Candidatus Dormibacteraeota bacterium]|nr:TonB-dependent receptor [Candidatus Dormibacteraeota bacterium]